MPAAKKKPEKKPKSAKKAPPAKATLAGVVTELASVTDAKKRRPATDEQLDAIAALLGEVPADLRALYGFAGNLDAVLSGVSLEWLGVGDAVKSCRLNRDFEAPERLFPIATDGAGNFACFGSRQRQDRRLGSRDARGDPARFDARGLPGQDGRPRAAQEPKGQPRAAPRLR